MIEVAFEAVCGASSNPTDGNVAIEAQAQVGQVSFDLPLPLEPIPIATTPDDRFEIVYFAPEPGATLLGAACVATLARLRRRATRRLPPIDASG